MNQLTRVEPINFVLKIQIVTLVLIGLVLFLWQEWNTAIAGVYGAAIGVVSMLLQRHHLILAAHTAKADAGLNLRKAYRCVVERWFISIVMFLVGFTVLNLLPLPVLIGFTATQLVLFIGNMDRA